MIARWSDGRREVVTGFGNRDEAERWIRQARARPGGLAIPLDPATAAAAAVIADLPGDPADRMIYATARATGSQLVTRDRALRDFDPRGTLW